MLRFIFNKFRFQFYEFMIADFFGDIPNDVSEPSLEFLTNAKGTLEKFFSIQAYNLTKKYNSDAKHSDFYAGSLMIVKAFLVAIQKAPVRKEVAAVKEKPFDFTNSIEEFKKMGKEFLKENTKS